MRLGSPADPGEHQVNPSTNYYVEVYFTYLAANPCMCKRYYVGSDGRYRNASNQSYERSYSAMSQPVLFEIPLVILLRFPEA